jgi:phospholipid/cholesterol/gamma-HCH transport system substrate-binding protein
MARPTGPTAALAAVAVLAAAALVTTVLVGSGGYRLSVMLPGATNLVAGTPIRMQGFPAGRVERITAVGDRARVEFSVDGDHAPLHSGATVRVGWKALLGERIFEVTDGPAGAAALPDGAMVTGQMPAPVEVDNVLSMLDPPTRARLASLVRNLDGTVTGSATDMNATLRAAGPTVDALGNVLRGVGTDGEAIRQLVTRLNGLVTTLNSRDDQLQGVVNHLGDASAVLATKQQQLSQVLAKAPVTLDKATTVLADLPATVDAASPLLDDLRPVSERLRPVAGNLRPLLDDLRPTLDDLRPTLDSASRLLGRTPDLLDSLGDTLPGSTEALRAYGPALEFVRPYTPELAGWMSNWASAMANYDSNGHYARGMVQTGVEAWNANPGWLTGPGVSKDLTPLPGAAAGEPWPDAYGSGMR